MSNEVEKLLEEAYDREKDGYLLEAKKLRAKARRLKTEAKKMQEQFPELKPGQHYAWYSFTQSQDFGTVVWAAADGGETEVTMVTTTPNHGAAFKDMKYRGVVTQYLRKGRSERIKYSYKNSSGIGNLKLNEAIRNSKMDLFTNYYNWPKP